MRWLWPRLRRSERGANAVEFALLLPFLALLLLGTIDFGRFGFAAITVSNAARHAASVCMYGETCELSDDQIKQQAKDEASPYLTLVDALITVNKNPAGAQCDDPTLVPPRPCLWVEVRYDFETLFPWPGIPSSFPIIRTARMPRGIA